MEKRFQMHMRNQWLLTLMLRSRLNHYDNLNEYFSLEVLCMLIHIHTYFIQTFFVNFH